MSVLRYLEQNITVNLICRLGTASRLNHACCVVYFYRLVVITHHHQNLLTIGLDTVYWAGAQAEFGAGSSKVMEIEYYYPTSAGVLLFPSYNTYFALVKK